MSNEDLMFTEWQAWQNVVKALKGASASIDINVEDTLARALEVWGEELGGTATDAGSLRHRERQNQRGTELGGHRERPDPAVGRERPSTSVGGRFVISISRRAPYP
jgi:hypothetical protein